MIRILVRIAIPLLFLVIIFVPIENQILYWSQFLVLALLVYIFYLSEDKVSVKLVEKETGESGFFSIPVGIISSKNDGVLQKGLLVVTDKSIRFFKKGKSFNSCVLEITIPTKKIASYSFEKVDDFHQGVTFILDNDSEQKFTSRKISKYDAELTKALGWDVSEE